MPSCRPSRREHLGLLQDGLHGGVLKVGRVAVLAEYVFDQNAHACPRRLPVLPVHGGITFQAAQKLMGNDAKLVVAHDLNRALVLGQGVIEGDFLLAETLLFAALVCGADVFGELRSAPE